MIVAENILLNVVLFGSSAVSVLAMVVAVACVSRLRKQAALTQALYKRLDHNLQISSASSVGMGKRIVALEKRLKLSAEKGEAVTEVSQPESTSKIASIDAELKDAAALLNAGLEPEEVARRCGISRAEASLLKMMHSQVHQAA